MSEDAEFKNAVKAMRNHFLVPAPPEEVFARLDGLVDSLDPDHRSLGLNFRHNLSSMLSSVSIPFALASAHSQDRHFQRIHSAERIRAIPIESVIGPDTTEPDQGLDEVLAREAYQKAVARMTEFEESEQGRNAVILGTCSFLLSSIQSEDLKFAASELIRQGIVLIWSAFEILFRDTFEQELNLTPSKAKLLAENVSTRKRFEVERFSLETLIQHGFDLSDNVGTVLVGQQDFSDLPTIKSVVSQGWWKLGGVA